MSQLGGQRLKHGNAFSGPNTANRGRIVPPLFKHQRSGNAGEARFFASAIVTGMRNRIV